MSSLPISFPAPLSLPHPLSLLPPLSLPPLPSSFPSPFLLPTPSSSTGELSVLVTVVDEEAARTNASEPGPSGTVLEELGDTVVEEAEELGVNVTVENIARFGE